MYLPDKVIQVDHGGFGLPFVDILSSVTVWPLKKSQKSLVSEVTVIRWPL